MTSPRWNANLHAFERLLAGVPSDARLALDVGCGEGETARRLRRRVPAVVGVDPHEPSIATARSFGDDIEYVVGDVLDEATVLPGGPFDVVSAVAMLHHVDHERGLRRLADLVAPGGRLLVVGLSFSRTVADHARDVRDVVALRRHTMTKDVWETSAPVVWPPPLSYDQVRARTAAVLPDAEFRRVPYLRYTVTWTRPRGA